MIQAFIAFLQALPELLKLIQTLQARIDEAALNRKVADDVKAINEAFQSKDPAKLNALFRT